MLRSAAAHVSKRDGLRTPRSTVVTVGYNLELAGKPMASLFLLEFFLHLIPILRITVEPL